MLTQPDFLPRSSMYGTPPSSPLSPYFRPPRPPPIRPIINTSLRPYPDHLPPHPRSCPVFRSRYPYQTGRHRPNNNTPYAKPPGDRDGSSGRRRPDGPPPPLATRLHKAGKTNLNPNPRRQPVGTPPILKQARVENKAAQEASHAKLRKQLGSEDMKQWLRSRLIGEGIMDMSVSISKAV